MERNFEIAMGMLCLREKDARGCKAVARNYRGTFGTCTQVVVGLLKAWNVTVVCDDAIFKSTSRRYKP